MTIPDGEGEGRQPSEEELRAAYEQEIKRIRVEHVLLEHAVTMINLGMRRTGLAPGTEGERDPAQVRLAIESIRAQLPLLEVTAPDQVAPLRDALSQLQMAFVRIGGQSDGAPEEPAAAASQTRTGRPSERAANAAESCRARRLRRGGGAGPAQRSGRLWVPGQ